MSLPAPIRRRAAAFAVVCGFSVFAAALGGMTSVDAELRAVAPLDETELVRFDEPQRPANACEESGEDAAERVGREL